MPRSLNRTLSVVLAATWLAGTATIAQAQATAPAAKPAAPAAKASAPVAKPAKKPAKAAPKAPPPEVPPPAADADQLKAAAMTHIGAYQCELNQAVEVSANPKYD